MNKAIENEIIKAVKLVDTHGKKAQVRGKNQGYHAIMIRHYRACLKALKETLINNMGISENDFNKIVDSVGL